MSKPTERGRQIPANQPRALLERIAAAPGLVRQLQPDLIHRAIQRFGLEACGDIVALATPEQLRAVFDVDLWKADHPGTDEQFDPDRFAEWIEVLVEAGEEVAARKLAELDVELVVTGLSQHIRAFDLATLRDLEPSEEMDLDPASRPGQGESCDLGGYRLVARRSSPSWDAIVSALTALDAEYQDRFHDVLRRCVALSHEGFEIDGLDNLLADADQAMFELASAREERREQQGFATPAEARAFLQGARHLDRGQGSVAPVDPLARAYFRNVSAVETEAPEHTAAKRAAAAPNVDEAREDLSSADAHDAVADLVVELNRPTRSPRALLSSGDPSRARVRKIDTLLESIRERDAAAYSTRMQELAYLANVLVTGCSIQARRFTSREASDAVMATCNLGLVHWPSHWAATDEERDFIAAFQVGWAVLYEDVCMPAAGRLIRALTDMLSTDASVDFVDPLRVSLKRHWEAGEPWRARDDIDAIAILDLTAWASLLGLIDECPAIHGALVALQRGDTRAIDPSAFDFIADNEQLALVRGFLDRLPALLAR